MAEETKKPAAEAPKTVVADDKPSVEDLAKAAKHLVEVAEATQKLGLDDKGQPKPGCNYHFFNTNVVFPLQTEMNTKPTKALVAKILALKAEEPTIKKFYRPIQFKNPVK